ncbi:hypothetical protein PVAP13_3KG399102 [Panicum virgatum]|uniref:Uncharacterized protein n=1 Tax=Panicum virgatum TaxID=38727 RepID=A0A8T0V4C5_PANVG|nr:hypothetical protein PVAP13_3KG399102 [Panicum virgatum]
MGPIYQFALPSPTRGHARPPLSRPLVAVARPPQKRPAPDRLARPPCCCALPPSLVLPLPILDRRGRWAAVAHSCRPRPPSPAPPTPCPSQSSSRSGTPPTPTRPPRAGASSCSPGRTPSRKRFGSRALWRWDDEDESDVDDLLISAGLLEGSKRNKRKKKFRGSLPGRHNVPRDILGGHQRIYLDYFAD